MNIQEFKKNPDILIKKEIIDLDKYKPTNSLIKKYNSIFLDINIKYQNDISLLFVNGIIDFSLDVIDARDGKPFVYKNKIEWNEEYSFNSNIDDHTNLIIGDDFDLTNYAIEQININIPINLSINHDIIFKVGSGWMVMSETDFEKNIDNNLPDPRWEKLNDFIKKPK